VLAHLDPMARLSRFRPQGFGPVGWHGAFTAYCRTASAGQCGRLAPVPRLCRAWCSFRDIEAGVAPPYEPLGALAYSVGLP